MFAVSQRQWLNYSLSKRGKEHSDMGTTEKNVIAGGYNMIKIKRICLLLAKDND